MRFNDDALDLLPTAQGAHLPVLNRALERKLENEFEFQADLDHFAIFGTCGKCSKKKLKEKQHAHS